jgi:hypothetical protein
MEERKELRDRPETAKKKPGHHGQQEGTKRVPPLHTDDSYGAFRSPIWWVPTVPFHMEKNTPELGDVAQERNWAS